MPRGYPLFYYAPEATWIGATPPEPVFLMHQLGGLPRNPKFLHLDAGLFASKVQAMLASLVPGNATR